MRTTYLVCYDVADDKRLRRTFKACCSFGDHLQFSVFECDLNPSEKIELETALGKIINQDEDQVLFISLGPAEGRGDRVITSMGFGAHVFVRVVDCDDEIVSSDRAMMETDLGGEMVKS